MVALRHIRGLVEVRYFTGLIVISLHFIVTSYGTKNGL